MPQCRGCASVHEVLECGCCADNVASDGVCVQCNTYQPAIEVRYQEIYDLWENHPATEGCER